MPPTPPQRPSWRVWRTYNTDPLPAQAEALAMPLKAFPGWFLCIRCERCGETRMVKEAHASWRDLRLVPTAPDAAAGCGGEAASVASAAASRAASASARFAGSCSARADRTRR